MRSPPRDRTAVVAIVLLTLLAFYPVMSAEFTTWDDNHTIADNPNLKTASLAGLAQHWTHASHSLFVPMTYTTWWLIAQVARSGDALNPWIFHSANLIVHVLAAVALFQLLRRRLAFDTWPAMCGAMMFAVHPIQVEAVGWTSGMKDVLCGLFVILALDRYIARKVGTCIVLFILAMLTKPVAIVFPFIALVFDVFMLKRSLRDVIRSTWFVFALAIPCIVWSKWIQPATDVATVAIYQRPLIALDALGSYVIKLCVPARFAIDYGRSPRFVLIDASMFLTASIAVLLLLAVALLRKRKIFAGLGIFIIGFLPVLGLVRFEFQTKSTVADHYAYIPMIGVALIAASLVAIHRRAVPAAVVVLFAIAIRSNVQARTWHDSRALFEHALTVNPRSAAAHLSLSTYWLDNGRLDLAESHARDTVRLAPDEPSSYTQLGTALGYQSRFPEAAEQFRIATTRWPNEIAGHLGLARALLDLNQPADAVAEYDLAIRLQPGNASLKPMRDAAAAAAARAEDRSTTQPAP